MNERKQIEASVRDGFEMAAQMLIRCFIGGAVVLLAWTLAYVCAPDWLYRMNAWWFPITREQFVVVNYCGIALVKMFVLLVFFVPYISIRLVLRKHR